MSLPNGVSLITYKWIFRVKLLVDEALDTYKARLMIRVFFARVWC